MEINDQNLAQLSEVLKQTLNPDATERKKAEVCHRDIVTCCTFRVTGIPWQCQFWDKNV